MKVYAQKDRLAFLFEKEHISITVSGPALLESAFPGLGALYFQNPHTISAPSLLGLLVGSEGKGAVCANLPLGDLQGICEVALRPHSVLAFLQVSRCFIPHLCVTVQKSGYGGRYGCGCRCRYV
jgi:hypothetical protein